MLLFARSDLYADRGVRPGLTRIVTSLFQVTVVALVFALASGHHFSSYYIFYGSLVLRDRVDRRAAALGAHARHRLAARAAGYRRRALLVGSGKHIDEVAHALAATRAARSSRSATSR